MADNGMIVSEDDYTTVIENSHKKDGGGRENLYRELGKIFYSEISHVMEQETALTVKVKLEINKMEENYDR